MKTSKQRIWQTVLMLTVLLIIADAPGAHAQWTRIWLDVGSYHHQYVEGGGYNDGPGSNGSRYPGAYQYSDNQKSEGLWIGVRNFTDENGTHFPVRVAHFGPKANLGVGEMFGRAFEMTSRFDPPTVMVDGIHSFRNPVFNDIVDPELGADRMLYNRVNTILGLTMERRIMQFSQEFHDNYHLIEYTFTNTGYIGGTDQAQLNQTLEDIQIGIMRRYNISEVGRGVIGGGAGWGQNAMIDAVGDGHEDYEESFRAQYKWHGYRPQFSGWNNVGIPVLRDSPAQVQEGDTVGTLAGAHFIGRAYVHADRSANDPTDDPGQPSTMSHYDADDPLVLDPDAFDVPRMQEEYEFISAGRTYPHHADLVEPGGPWDAERFAYGTNDPSLGRPGGWGTKEGFGPYTLEPGESIRIVIVEGVAGLSEEAKRVIGRAYRDHWVAGNDHAPIAFDANGDGEIGPDEIMSKNMWVMTARDSLFQMFERAIANYQSGFDIPRAPRPPQNFSVTSNTDRIELQWESYPGENPVGWEVYRATGRLSLSTPHELIAELGPDARSYNDTEVTRGINYYYYLQAVGDVNNDPTGLTPTGVRLRSNRYFTQTYTPAILKRASGETLASARIVPNPFNLGSSPDVRWPDQQDRIGFLDIPGDCSIRIYTELGVLVETIEHRDGSGDAYWNLTTSANQVVASGIYLAVIRDNETGEQIVRPFSIIR